MRRVTDYMSVLCNLCFCIDQQFIKKLKGKDDQLQQTCQILDFGFKFVLQFLETTNV